MSGSQQAWVDYYTALAAWVGEDVISSGDCLVLSYPRWSIISITPMRPFSSPFDRDQFVLYNDPNCVSVNRELASKTGYILISSYFSKVPLSMRWTRIQPLPPIPTTTTTTTPSITTPSSNIHPSTPVEPKLTPSSVLLSLSLSTATPTGAIVGLPPTPIRTTFPTALIPPNPADSTAGWGDHSCSDATDGSSSSDPACQTSKHVNQFLIAGITISIVVLVLMTAGTVYIYRTYYAPDHPTSSFMSSSAYRNGSSPPSHPGSSSHHQNNSNTNGGSSHGDHRSGTNTMDDHQDGQGDANPDYVYIHDENELEGAPQRFMFDHSRDNINTNKNPKLFKESSTSPSSSRTRYSGTLLTFANSSENNASDINLLERTR
ncbi:hypothetical protein BGZ70_002326 [Mortierella alpina]|uniref:Uncharacterized protein n=1 Tax=Mortierella alpina TaxID=64518 RepID=A0A9P6M5D7_MORAP|nr:hypothetical protein BGZ70_002326 [Mortierella alpina]